MDFERYADCEELSAAFDLAQSPLWAQAAAEFVPDDVFAMVAGEAAGPAPTSRTLLQEQGVGEHDQVATDGRWSYALDRDGVAIVDLRAVPEGGATREVYARIALDARPLGLYLDGDQLVVVGQGLTGAYRGDAASVTVIDVRDRAQPEIVREAWTPGILRDSRMQGDRLVLVTTAAIVSNGLIVGIDPATARAESDPGPWMPPGVACTDVWVDLEQDRIDLTTVSTLDLADPGSEWRGAAVLGSVAFAYADLDTVWLATRDGSDTALHRVELAGKPALADTVAVPGRVPSRWGVSEASGVLRVVSEHEGASRVTTYDADGDVLGEVVGLAPGEQLMTARFDGDRAYVVTYEVPRGDPLFVVDLRVPAAPVVVGELHVPGWSDLLLPIPGDRLLAVGMDFGPNGTARAAVSLFGVGADGPVLLDRALLAGHDTEARFDLRAWAWANGRLALPTRRGIEVLGVGGDQLVAEGVIATPKGARHADRAVIVGDTVYGTSAKGRRTHTWGAEFPAEAVAGP